MGDKEENKTEESIPFARTCVLAFDFTLQRNAINYTRTRTAEEQ